MFFSIDSLSDWFGCKEYFDCLTKLQLVGWLDCETNRQLNLRCFRPNSMRKKNVRSKSEVAVVLSSVLTDHLQVRETWNDDVDVLIGILDLNSQVLSLMFLQILDLSCERKCGNQSRGYFYDVLNRRCLVWVSNLGSAHLDLSR